MSTLSSSLKDWLGFLSVMFQRQETVSADKMPLVLHEPAVLTGYRLLDQPWSYYTKSLFQLHNETLNVWTHLVASVVLIHQVYSYLQVYSDSQLSVTVMAMGYCFFLTVFVSAVVHLYHSRSPFYHYAFFMVDYATAAFCLYGTGLVAMYGLSDSTYYHTMGNIYLLLQSVSTYVVFVTVCVSKMWYGDNPHNMRRKHMLLAVYVFHALFNCTPVLPKYLQCYRDPDCSLSSLNRYFIVFVLTCLQAVSFLAHQPERTWPGKFDIIGHSHQWFHVITCISHVMQFKAIHYDYQHGLNVHCQPDARNVFLAIAMVTLADILTLVYLIRQIPKVIASDTNDSKKLQ